jgi:hypothetical protein
MDSNSGDGVGEGMGESFIGSQYVMEGRSSDITVIIEKE